jgi:hypothetical protein
VSWSKEVSEVEGRRKEKILAPFVFEAFIVVPSSSCDERDARRVQTRSTRGGVLNITSFISFVIVFVFPLFISKL